MTTLWSFTFILLLSACAFMVAADKLLFVVEYCRHGARLPGKEIKGAFPWVTDPRALTGAGMRQHYILGRQLRERYIVKKHFLDEHYNPNQIVFRASDNDRTVASLYAQLSGLFVSGTGKSLPSELANSAVPPNVAPDYPAWINLLGKGTVNYMLNILPIRVVQKKLDIYLQSVDGCSSVGNVTGEYGKVFRDTIHGKENDFAHVITTFKGVFNESFKSNAKKKEDERKSDMDMVSSLRDVLICAQAEGVLDQIPLNATYADTLINMSFPLVQYKKYNTDLLVKIERAGYEVSKVMANNFLRTTQQYLAAAANYSLGEKNLPLIKNGELKYVLNVASDTEMHTILLQLGMNNEHMMVKFASMLLFEIYRNESVYSGSLDQYYVNITLNKDPPITHSLLKFNQMIVGATYNEADYDYYCHRFEANSTSWQIPPVNDDPLVMWGLIGMGICIAILLIVMIAARLFSTGGTTQEDSPVPSKPESNRAIQAAALNPGSENVNQPIVKVEPRV